MEELNEIRCAGGCGKTDKVPFGETQYHEWARQDAYGIPTGLYCEECYNSNRYPYKKDKYDYEAYGETLEDDY